MEIRHYPVMHKEVLEYLLIPPGKSCMIDCTTGEGGHTSLFLSNYPDLEVIGLDRDRDIQAKAIERLAPFGSRFHPVLSWFDDYLAQADADSADAVLFDLGISMFHYAESGRGFSFRNGERLDMRLDADGALSAADVVNGYGEEALAAEEVVPGDAEGGDDLHGLIGDVEHGDAHEHAHIGQAETDRREDREDRELALAAHIVTVVEHVAHAENVVHHDRGDKRDGRAE